MYVACHSLDNKNYRMVRIGLLFKAPPFFDQKIFIFFYDFFKILSY